LERKPHAKIRQPPMREFPDHQPAERDPLGPKPTPRSGRSAARSAIDPICDRDEEPGPSSSITLPWTMAFRELVVGTRSGPSPTGERTA
jgi:hypothetical protein